MSTQLLNLAGNQRLNLADALYLAQTQPLGQQADLVGSMLCDATRLSSLYILHGFGVRSGIAGANANPAQNQLQVAPGKGVLAYRQGAGAPLYGVMAALDGIEQVAQTIDLTYQPSGAYTVWMRLNYSASAQTDRSFWSAADPGFEYSQLQATRQVASWEVQALGIGSNPGAEWVAIASLSWSAPSSQGGTGTISSLVDTRPLFFEGMASASTPFSSAWGSGTNDRSSDRGTYGIGNLHTFLSAMRTCLEDIKGPGLRRWWEPSIGGINLGFTPNTPTLGRLALGDASFYIQGRTSATGGHAFFASQKDTNGNITGWDFASDRTRYLLAGTPLVTYSGFGTIGFGSLVETGIFGSAGRSLVEMVVSAPSQSALRLGAQAVNGASPVGLDVIQKIVAPDQSGNLAQVAFVRGGIQGPEQPLYMVGKGANNDFHIYDTVNGQLAFDYNYATRSLTLGGGDFSYFDNLRGVSSLSYQTSSQRVNIPGLLQIGSLLCLNMVTVNQGLTVGGQGQFNNNLNVIGAISSGSVASPSFQVGGYTFASYTVNGGQNNGSVNIPQSGQPPLNPQPGAVWFRAGAAARTNTDRAYIYAPNWNGAVNKSVDGLPNGWVAIVLTTSNNQTG